MRQTKTILKKAHEYRQDALTTIAAYRLYIYLKWEDIPEDIRESFPEGADKDWDDNISVDDLEADIELQIKGILTNLTKRKVVVGAMMTPAIFADLFMMGHKTGGFEGIYKGIIREYEIEYEIDPLIADLNMIRDLSNLLKKLADKAQVKLEFDIEEMTDDIIMDIANNIREDTGDISDPINAGIDKALEDYREKTGKDILEGLEEGVNFDDED